MGIASSNASSSPSGTVGEGEHFNVLVNPGKARIPSSEDAEPAPASSSSTVVATKVIMLHPKARVLKSVLFEDLWNAFLSSALNSFALTPAELQSLFFDIIHLSPSEKNSNKKEVALLENEVKEYVALLVELSDKDTSKTMDFMAVCSSVLFLSDYPIESKVDILFQWITLNPELRDFSFEDFVIAICSFERGLSHALGKTASSEAFIKDVSTQWFALADPAHKGVADSQTRISDTAFFDFCMNRQHVVRKLLESFSNLFVVEDKNTELNEVVDTLDELKKPSSGGDEWMANPAWKKTAERMIPPQYAAYRESKPASNLELEWVHGYRGFDCRNNIHYVDSTGSRVLYHAAALAITQEQSRGLKKQFYFGEHKDDITCLATHRVNDSTTLIASGEIGKNPGICLYVWGPSAGGDCFQPLATFQGFHKRGISQLAFSADGKHLFSIGVEYSVAIYCTDKSSKQFGKMVVSAQGPKDRILHATSCGLVSGDYMFVSCGEKHAIVWTFSTAKGGLKQDNCKFAGGGKNQLFLSCASLPNSQVIMSTQTGEFHTFNLAGKNVSAMRVEGDTHGKSAINALYVANSKLVSGDKDGKVIIWSASDATLSCQYSFKLTGFCTTPEIASLSTEPVKRKPTDNVAKPPAVRAITVSDDGRRMLVGTQTCELIEYTLPSSTFLAASNKSESVAATSLVVGHYLDEVWGLAVRPITEHNYTEGVLYATTGDDQMLRIWHLQSHALLLTIALPCASRSCAFSPDGSYVLCGMGASKKIKDKKAMKETSDGAIRIYRIETSLEPDKVKVNAALICEIKDAKQAISTIQYSPDGTLLAVGCRDNCIYMYSVPNQYKRKFKFSKHNAGITQLDFTADSKYLQSNCR
ncbi:hypothetical protein EON65_22795 [archaeon]|nr:MAG: hypothetical protein EON65_22795 [archaeon]